MNSIFVFTLCLLGFTSALPEPPSNWFQGQIDDPTVVALTPHIVEHHNKQSESLFYKKLIQVVSARARFDGDRLNYEITLDFGTTKCPKSDPDVACQLYSNVPIERCTYSLYVTIGATVPEIGDGQCEQASGNFILGGWSPVSTEDPKVIELTERVVEHHNKMNDNTQKLETIKSARAQVVAGINYEITFSTKSTTDGVSQECTYTFWDKPGDTSIAEITNVICKSA